MPDDIFAEMSDGNGNFVSFRIFVGAQRISSTTLRREIAVELHRRINRIPEDAPEVSCCAVCNATAEEAPPGLRKDDAGAWLCYDRKACVDRMWAAGQTQASADEMYHRQHCAACRAIEGHTPSLIEWAARESARYVVDRWMKGDF